MRVLLFRHGETPWTISGQHTGRTEVELTEVGEAQARASSVLFERLLQGHLPDFVYSSPRKRALRTAELALSGSPQPVISDLLAEFDYGKYEGLTPAEIKQIDPAWSLWEHGCPGGESVEQVTERADRFIELLRGRHDGQTVCAVSHGHMIRVLTARMLNLPAREGRIFSIKTASLAELAWKEQRFILQSWNLTI